MKTTLQTLKYEFNAGSIQGGHLCIHAEGTPYIVAQFGSKQEADDLIAAVNEHAALVAVAEAAKNREKNQNDDGCKAHLEIALANLAAVRNPNRA